MKVWPQLTVINGKTEVEKHSRNKYEDGCRTVADAMAEVDVLRSLQESSGEFPPEIVLEDLVQARTKLSKTKQVEVAAPR